MSGFTGSNGTLVVSKTEARLWTDGRYFIQCEKEISGSSIRMMKMAEAGVPTITEYLAKEMKAREKEAKKRGLSCNIGDNFTDIPCAV